MRAGYPGSSLAPPARRRDCTGLSQGYPTRAMGDCASGIPRVRERDTPGQVVRRRYSCGSFCGSVRTSSMITKFASEYMWGR